MNLTIARDICKTLEPIAAANGGHVALTGGCLYKDGDRKDCDIVIYRHKQAEPLNRTKLFKDMIAAGFVPGTDYGRISKWTFNQSSIDLFTVQDAPEFWGRPDYL